MGLRLRPHNHRRMGIPYRERGISVIALIVDGDTDTLGAMTGKLGASQEESENRHTVQ